VETLLVWISRGLLLVMGGTALVWMARWIRDALRERRERWAIRTALGMAVLAGAYAMGHARLLLQSDRIEEGRARYAVYGDPRMAELRRAEVRGWLLDCTGRDENALVQYARVDGSISRSFPLGEAGANLIGGGEAAGERDYTMERLFASRMREPKSWSERGQLHPAGRDLRSTLCRDLTRQAWRSLQNSGRPGAVVVQNVQSGAVLAYAATGGPQDAPVGVRRYAPPGSVFKLALAALWWESGLEDTPMPCPASIQVTERARISNAGGFSIPAVSVPHGMLVPSCNTTAVEMALLMRERLGAAAFEEAYRRYGFVPYEASPPATVDADFWSTSSTAWKRRMSPPVSRLRMSERTGDAEWAQLAIGQGPIDVTVVGMSRFLQAIGNDGVMIRPTLEWEHRERPGRVERVMSEATAHRLHAAMREVVERGTARSVAGRLRGTGWSLGGKTGTAQIAGAPDDGWFAGLVFGPDERPHYSVVVYLQGGGPGGARPASIAADVARALAEGGGDRGEVNHLARRALLLEAGG
jgi:hypothetical protein